MSIANMREYLAGFKGSGRTTRMVQDALRLLGLGVQSIIVVQDEEKARVIRQMLKPIIVGVEVRTIDELGQINWELCRPLYDVNGQTNYIFDHSVIEMRLTAAIDMLHRYDPD